MVTGTLLLTSSSGEGVTVKLSAESSPSLLHEESTSPEASATNKNDLVCIKIKVWLMVFLRDKAPTIFGPNDEADHLAW